MRRAWGAGSLVAMLVVAVGAGPALAAPATAQGGSAVYTPTSDVAPHAALGRDIEAIKAELDTAKDGAPIDWTVVARWFALGGSSIRSDGSPRAFQTQSEALDDIAYVQSAIDGTGPNASASDAVRAQAVDKGISVLLARMMLSELAEGREKIAAGDVEPVVGAPHQVDEAWAFFTADGFGLASTADKRATDFDREGEVTEPIIEALTAAQTAAAAGDLASYDAAVEDVRRGLNLIFYLATYKYLDHDGDPVAKAEGLAFYRGIEPTIVAAAPGSAQKITAAFERGARKAGRKALNKPAVLAALGLTRADAEK